MNRRAVLTLGRLEDRLTPAALMTSAFGRPLASPYAAVAQVATPPTTVSVAQVTTPWASEAHPVALTATVNVSVGLVKFTVLKGTTVVGTPTSAALVNRTAVVQYMLPAGLAAGLYTVRAEYGGAYLGSSGAYTGTIGTSGYGGAISAPAAEWELLALSVGPRPTQTNVATAATYSAAANTVQLSATLIAAGFIPVNGGTVAFSVLNPATGQYGPPVTATVANGRVTAAYPLSTGMVVTGGTITVRAVFAGTATAAGGTVTATVRVPGAPITPVPAAIPALTTPVPIPAAPSTPVAPAVGVTIAPAPAQPQTAFTIVSLPGMDDGGAMVSLAPLSPRKGDEGSITVTDAAPPRVTRVPTVTDSVAGSKPDSREKDRSEALAM